MFFEFDKFINSSAFGNVQTCLRKQLLYYRTYLSTYPICFIIWVIFHFCYCYYYRVGQTIFWWLHLHDTCFQMGHDWERTAPAFNSTTETHRHPNRMYSHDQIVKGVKSSVWLWNLYYQGQYYIAANRSLRLKPFPIGLFWFSRFCIVISTMSLSLRFCNAWRNRSFRLAKKWLTRSIGSDGRRRRTSCVPVARKLLYSRVIIINLESVSHGLQN